MDAPDTVALSRKGRQAEAPPPDRPVTGHRAHFVLQGKGGVGKTLVALLLAQCIAETGDPLTCLDLDPVNASLTALSPFASERVAIFAGRKVDGAALDRFAERIIGTPENFVIDNGAAGFVPMCNFLLANGIAELMAEHRRSMVIHVPVTGGSGMVDCAKGLAYAVEQFPHPVQIVPWINEVFGPVQNKDGRPLIEMPVYLDNRDRMPAVVTLPELDEQATADLREMIERRLTFADAIRPDNPTMLLLQRSRLSRLRATLWPQIARVL